MDAATNRNCKFIATNTDGTADSPIAVQDDSAELQPDFPGAVIALLMKQHSVATRSELDRFADILARSIRQRLVSKNLLLRVTDSADIIHFIHSSVLADDRDEAIWRCFLAAHFGRTSARGDVQISSAARLLCAFQSSPVWTWEVVSNSPLTLKDWLDACPSELATLAFGNHRKYESQRPKNIWRVMESFVRMAKEHGGPANLFMCVDGEFDDPFDVFYRRAKPVWRFGRTGRFDFLVLLTDVGLLSIEPKSSYLKGATGPLKGARQLWGNGTPTEHDARAAELARQLCVSPIAIEDALCNWQK